LMSKIRNIYLVMLTAMFKYKKETKKRDVEIVSKYNTRNEIMADDISMNSIEEKLYPKNYKSERKIMVKEIVSSKIIGQVSNQNTDR
jgi:hypothetical protein